MSGKRLTPAEATARLPFLAAVAAEAADAALRLAQLDAAFRAEKARPVASQAFLNETRNEMRRLRADVERCLAEAASAGVTSWDVAGRRMDFESELDGAPVVLCWEVGEPRVEHFHAPGEPHSARRPLPVPVHA